MFKTRPVAVMTTILTALIAVAAALIGAHVFSPAVAAVVGVVVAVLTAVLGVITHGNVTPTANPHDDFGRPLFPAGPRSISDERTVS
jgi:hypothetical protein